MIITFIIIAFDNHSHEENMAAQIIKFCNKAERKKADERAKRAWDDTFHLTLSSLTPPENYMVWMVQHWVHYSIRKQDPLPVIAESVKRVFFHGNKERFVEYSDYILYLFSHITSYPLTLGCQQCNKLGSFELNFIALISYEQSGDHQLSKNLLGHLLGVNYSEETRTYFNALAKICSENKLNFTSRPEYQDLFQLRSNKRQPCRYSRH